MRMSRWILAGTYSIHISKRMATSVFCTRVLELHVIHAPPKTKMIDYFICLVLIISCVYIYIDSMHLISNAFRPKIQLPVWNACRLAAHTKTYASARARVFSMKCAKWAFVTHPTFRLSSFVCLSDYSETLGYDSCWLQLLLMITNDALTTCTCVHKSSIIENTKCTPIDDFRW